MGRSRIPTPMLDAKGSFLKHAERRRPNEPQSTRPLGPPPKYLSADLKQVWKEIAKRILSGVASEADRDAFEMMVRLTYKQRNPPEKLDTVEARAAIMTSAERSTLISLWSRFAMTPADRSKVSVDKPKDSALANFMRRRPETPPPAEEQSLIN